MITGNPGTGKHTSARLVARRLKAEIVDINKLAIENEAVAGRTAKGLEVNLKKLGRLVAGILKKKGNFVVVGHLAPYVVKTAGIDMVAVLRRSPARLEQTLKERGYILEKVNENVSAEVLGISLYDSIKAFGKGKVAEFDTTGKEPEQTANDIVATAQKKKPKRAGAVDWLAVVSEEEVQRFFDY
ncbi:MAG TPA: AAA family ATPase [Nitrososphaera sp.]